LSNNRISVIRNQIPVPLLCGDKAPKRVGEYVLWVGRAESEKISHKRSELCLELARKCKIIAFIAIMNPAGVARHGKLSANAPKNLRIIEYVSLGRMPCFYQGARFLVNTSVREGFPNAALEAVSYSKPLISLKVGLDDFISRNHCGYVCRDDLGDMVDRVLELWSSPNLVTKFGGAARSYIETWYHYDDRIDNLVTVIGDVG